MNQILFPECHLDKKACCQVFSYICANKPAWRLMKTVSIKDEPTLPGFNDTDSIYEEKSSGCGGCILTDQWALIQSCADASCDGLGGLQSMMACCFVVPLAFMACFSC
ncbi:hypothetical protein AG1IA_06199 [Rhizoctonia solani AG-1 IA]|uniref:Uncharacterized protein n=1 Tax=Thanatephorus cucumeris (strain AG1-IA) TaxID=983506 RepID=L8WNS9_THACA|nr:hypothetical protein AG1IA_06199 [Rhizoctonia solani AG-1 IA]